MKREFPVKGGMWEVPDDWLKELNGAYLEVDSEIVKMRLWLIAKPEARPTVRGAKRFMLNWLKREPRLQRPFVTPYQLPKYEEKKEPLEIRLAHLAKLKELVK